MLIAHGDLFSPYSLKWRMFSKVQGNTLRERLAFVVPEGNGEALAQGAGARLAAAALSPVPQIVIDRRGFLVDANRRTRETFGLVASDIGRPFQDVPLSYRPADLRSAIDNAYEQRSPIRVERVRCSNGGEDRVLDVEVAPLIAADGEIVGASVTFMDVTALARLSDDYDRSKRELENAYEELQSTVEELETTNEELQSTNEELETTNEELQSTNEELETMNEELQSTNEELETMNDELRERTDETLQANTFLGSVLSGIRQGVIVVDRTLRVVAWSRRATDLWGLRDVEVEGEHLLNLDIGLPVQRLRDPIRRVVAGSGVPDLELEGHDRRGKPVRVRIAFAPLQNRPDAEEPDGAILLVSAERGG
jgi:two-component system CheB/CheR fusion protein